MIYNSITELIGNTPLYRPNNFCKENNVPEGTDILCKLEYLNPAGSIKDRTALSLIRTAEKEGLLKKGSVIIESTSGNTGIGLAAIGAALGYKVILTMPDTMTVERRKLLAAYGAEIVLTKGSLGMKGANDKAEELARTIEGAFLASQFSNPANPLAHKTTTGPEIYEATEGKIDVLVAGVGTGGTISGVGAYLKKKDPSIEIIAFEPSSSPLLSRGKSGSHGLQGIGANFIPDNLDRSVIDRIITISEADAYGAARSLARTEGILCGVTSGAALAVALSLTEDKRYIGKTIVALLPDTGDRYLSTPLFE